MNLKEAKAILKLIPNQTGFINNIFLEKILEKLWIKEKDNCADRQEFEFSLIENKKSIRFNHTYFCDNACTQKERVVVFNKRVVMLANIIKKNDLFLKMKLNMPLLDNFLLFISENKNFFPQIGFEYDLKEQLKIKLYLSVNGQVFPLQKFCNIVNFKFKKIEKLFSKQFFDTVAIDFMKNGEFLVKFYPVIGENEGLLLRLSKNGTVEARKIWRRFPDGLALAANARKFFNQLEPLFKYVIEKGMRISYLCVENNKSSCYFR